VRLAILSARREVQAAQRDHVAPGLGEVVDELAILADRIRRLRPAAECPHCAATGCEYCRGYGWINETQQREVG